MSKRFIFLQQSGDRKKPRLDFSVTDHNFPLSQNAASNNVADFDDNDDELLLQASQACEQACNASMLPAYSQFMRPAVTSTQLPTEPSTSKGIFSFKIPAMGQKNTVSTRLNDECERKTSPLCGIQTKRMLTIGSMAKDFNDKVVHTKDTDCVYRQLLQHEEENEKLKCENSKLLEKCVTKEGEASILRTQLKTCQAAVDNARLEKLKTYEQAQIHWGDKLNIVNKQLSDIKTQLDTKNLEIISLKEKCKMLESNKVKLTQITVAGNEMLWVNNNVIGPNNLTSQNRGVKTASTTVQTDNNPRFLKLSKPCRTVKSKLSKIIPIILEKPKEHQYSILDCNEKLKRPTDFSPNKSRTLSSFYSPLSTTDTVSTSKVKLDMSSIHDDLMCIACGSDSEKVQEHYVRVFEAIRLALEGVHTELELLSRRLTVAFQKEIDTSYMETTMEYLVVEESDLIGPKALLKEEQCILARRMMGVLHTLLEDETAVQVFVNMNRCGRPGAAHYSYRKFVDLLCRICALLDYNCCGLVYSGLIYSLLLVVESLAARSHLDDVRVLDVIKHIIPSRGLLFVPCRLLRMLCSVRNADVTTLCAASAVDVKVDYEQGVLLFNNDSCLIQVLLRQVEASIKCMEQQRLVRQVVDTTRDLVQLHSNVGARLNHEEKAQCQCGNLLIQVVVQSLKICSTMLGDSESDSDKQTPLQREALAVCRAGLQTLYRCGIWDVDMTTRLGDNEGNFLQFCERLVCYQHNEFYSTMLSEMLTTFQTVAEDDAATVHRHAWLRTFESVTLTD